MEFWKTEEKSQNNEIVEMIESIKSEEINNLCFECGTENPEYISINNGIFLCQECVQFHFQLPTQISEIIIDDLYSLTNDDLKKLYFSGNKKLIEFINFEFPKLKQFAPDILYKTRAVEYYRKLLIFNVHGGIKPIKPLFESAYLLINVQNNDLCLSPKVNISDKIFNNYELTPIIEGNPLEDENNLSCYSENKNKGAILDDKKDNLLPTIDSNNKNESTLINSPSKPITLNGNSDYICDDNCNSPIVSKSAQNEITNHRKNSKTDTINSIKKNINDDEKYHIDKNISCINIGDNSNLNINIDNLSNLNINNENNLNNYNLNDENPGEDNTLRIIDGFMNISKGNDSSYSIKMLNNSNSNNIDDDSIQIKLNNKGKKEYENTKNKQDNESFSNIGYEQNNKIINISNIDCINEKSKENNIRNIQKINSEKFENQKKQIKSDISKDRYSNNYDNCITYISPIVKKSENNYKQKAKDEHKLSDNDIFFKNFNDRINNRETKTKQNISNRININKDNKNKNYQNKTFNNKILKRKDISLEKEDEEEEEEEEEEENENEKLTKKIKEKKLIFPKIFNENDKKRTKKINKNEEKIKHDVNNPTQIKSKKEKNHKYLKAKVSITKIEDSQDEDSDNSEDSNNNKKKKKNPRIIINKKNKIKAKPKKDNFFSKNSSMSFINPFKYLKKSFQKRQDKKYRNDSDSDEEDEDEEEEFEEEEEEEEEFKIKNKIKNNKSKKNRKTFTERNSPKKEKKEKKIMENLDSSDSDGFFDDSNKKKVKTNIKRNKRIKTKTQNRNNVIKNDESENEE